MSEVLMCEANVSEGRRLDVVEQFVEAVRGVEGVSIADYSSDGDHHRSVITFLGPPEGVLQAAKNLATAVLEAVDMREHSGEHPRQGALDVVPFIPLRDLDTEQAVAIARRFGEWLGEQGVPVYYYEDAATREDRRSLPKIRKGQYEALEEKLADPNWAPDAGPAQFNAKAGATVTGARFPLIAFNVNLRTDELEIAQTIARVVRHINGGFKHVRGMGFALEAKGMVQVSMNLVNYLETPIPRVLETVRSEAARYGVQVAGTELIGPVPLGALKEVVRHYLQTHEFTTEQVVETALLP
jgi:glutamate formiminotransferase